MDITYLLWLQELRESAGPIVNAFFAFLGSEAALFLALLVPCIAYWCVDKQAGHFALMSYGLSSVFNQLVKNTVCCYRPWVRDARVQPVSSAIKSASGYSFPSGHTQSSASMLGALGWTGRKRVWPLVVGVAFTLLVGFSRNYLGVHTPQDILVGLVEGCVFVWLADRLLAWVDGGPGRDARVLAIGLALLVVFTAYVSLKPYPRDYVDGKLLVDPFDMLIDCYKTGGCLLGILLGWYIERHVVQFSTERIDLRTGALRLAIGAVIVAVCYVGGKLFVSLLGDLWGQFLRHAIVFFCAMVVAPLIFGRIEHGRAGR